jgi:hypothetical protein
VTYFPRGEEILEELSEEAYIYNHDKFLVALASERMRKGKHPPGIAGGFGP